MIQRKQTIWLLLAALSILLTILIPYGIHTSTSLETTTITESDLNAKSNLLLMISSIISCVFSFVLIFLYHNRKLQMSLTLLGVLVAIAVLGLQLYDATQTALGNKIAIGIVGSKIYLGIAVPIICIFFLMLAYAGIKKDEKIIRDSDRLR